MKFYLKRHKSWLLKSSIFIHIQDLRETSDDWRNYMRMNKNIHKELLRLVTLFIKRKNMIIPEAISPQEIKLFFKVSNNGNMYTHLRFSTSISYICYFTQFLIHIGQGLITQDPLKG